MLLPVRLSLLLRASTAPLIVPMPVPEPMHVHVHVHAHVPVPVPAHVVPRVLSIPFQ